MTDLELLDKWCDNTSGFVDPFLLREVESRGLYHIVNHLPSNREEGKAVVRARLATEGKAFGDDEIDKISGTIHRIEFVQKELGKVSMSDPQKTIPILDEMKELSIYVRYYYK